MAPDTPNGAGAAIDQTPSAPSPGGPLRTPTADGTEDSCAVPALPVVAVCLASPWGIAPLPEGLSALVGERVSGRLLSVTAGQVPLEVATIPDVDASRGGGLLGIALSPYYTEDQLIYLYVTTETDARILRLAIGQQPKAIVTGLPAGVDQPGGSIEFGDDGLLYVITGDGPSVDADAATTPQTVVDTTLPTPSPPIPSPSDSAPTAPTSGSPAVLRFDTSGNPVDGGAEYATGLVNPTGMCRLPGVGMGVVDHRSDGDVVIALRDGRDYRTLRPGDTVWTYSAGDGGALDCAVAAGTLLATARTKPRAIQLDMREDGGFTGAPVDLFDDDYGLLRTVTSGPGDVAWFVTSNAPATAAAPSADDRGTATAAPDPSDDRLIVLPPDSGGSGGLD